MNRRTFIKSVVLASIAASVHAAAATFSLREALTFHASFDHGPDADFGPGHRRMFSAPSMKHPRTGTPGLPTNGVVSIAKGEGRVGDALRFHRKAPELVFFQGERNFSCTKSNWSGAVAFWRSGQGRGPRKWKFS